MTKSEIHQRFIAQVQAELDAISDAAKKTFATATNEAHRAESKYDTFQLESSFLSRGLSMRVAELTSMLTALQGLPIYELSKESAVQGSALVRLQTQDGKTLAIFLGAEAGGETLQADGEEICMLSASSPLGQAVYGKRVGEHVVVKTGQTQRTYTVLSVA
jgi:transcription elongation GreA/GreB family factor